MYQVKVSELYKGDIMDGVFGTQPNCVDLVENNAFIIIDIMIV